MYVLIMVLFIAVLVLLISFKKRRIAVDNLFDAMNLPFVIIYTSKKAYCNAAASTLLDVGKGYIAAENVCAKIGNKKIRAALLSGGEFENEIFFVGGRKISASSYPAFGCGKGIGYVILFNEVTELAETQKKLKDSLEHIESLRFINHDFMNRMHVLMFYLETEQWDNAKGYIGSLQSLSVSEIASVVEMVRNPAVASLILSKIKKAADAGISLNIMPETRFLELTTGVTEGEYVTIVGNLLENAIEELCETEEKHKNIDLFINADSKCSLICVTDNGRGMNDEGLERIFDAGYSTKDGNERGVGLCAVKSIAEKHGGTVEIETEPGEGFFISVVMSAEDALGEIE